MANLGETPLGWEVTVLHLMLQAATVLVEDIDQQLRREGASFRQDKKKALKDYTRCIEQATAYMEKFGLDTSCWQAVHEDGRKYSNIIADANELIRLVMLYVDRTRSEEGFYAIFRHIRSLPEGGVFPDWFIGRFNMHHEWVPGAGDRVHTQHHGDGTLAFKANGTAWVINLDSGGQTVLNEDQFKLI